MLKFKPYNHKQSSIAVINNDVVGCKAYDPAILLPIILFAYSKGITSSREMQWYCETNIIFKALSCNTVPHFTTIAHFVSVYPDAIEQLFEQVLLICYQQGLLGNELFAKEWSGTFKELEQKRAKIKRQLQHHIKEHQTLDQNETKDEARLQRTAQAIDTLNKAADKIDDFLKKLEPRTGQGKRKLEVKINITDNESTKMTARKGTMHYEKDKRYILQKD